MRILLLVTFFILPYAASALEVDEKLTIRLLRLSRSKKTVLINRGLEDGLVVGDHAKFFLTSGVIARGVVAKASPSRSVWSVYRFVDPNQMQQDRVMSIKISTPLKLTDDSSRAFKGNQYASLKDNLAIPLERGADDLESQLSEEDRNDLISLGGNPPPPTYTYYNAGVDTGRTVELFGMAHLSSLNTSSSDETSAAAGTTTNINFSAGVEKYFAQKNSWLSQISIFFMFHKHTKEVTAVSGGKSTLDGLEYGLGLNYHFWESPLTYGKVIGYVSTSFGVGDVSDSLVTIDSSGTSAPQEFSGESTFVSFGGGFKYYVQNGFGARLFIDYYRRGETYAVAQDDGSGNIENLDFTKTLTGPRIQFGMSYRF